MKELDLLVENYFTPALDATDILRLVEQLMGEEDDDLGRNSEDAALQQQNDAEAVAINQPEEQEEDIQQQMADFALEHLAELFPKIEIQKTTFKGKPKMALYLTNTAKSEQDRRQALEKLIPLAVEKGIEAEIVGRRSDLKMVAIELRSDIAQIYIQLAPGSQAVGEGDPTVANKGDVAEGILAAALAARFRNTESGDEGMITKDNVYDILDRLNVGGKDSREEELREKGMSEKAIAKHMKKTVSRTIKFDKHENMDGSKTDQVILTVGLSNSNYADLVDKRKRGVLDSLYDSVIAFVNSAEVLDQTISWYKNNVPNVIEVIADGTSNQTGTKVDVRIKDNGKEISIGKISLKAAGTNQLGQIGREYRAMFGAAAAESEGLHGEVVPAVPAGMFTLLFGVEIDSKKHEEKWLKAITKEDRTSASIREACVDMYIEAEEKMREKRGEEGSEADKAFLEQLAVGIRFQAVLEEEGVRLIHLDAGDFKVLDFYGSLTTAIAETANVKSKVKIKERIDIQSDAYLKAVKAAGGKYKNVPKDVKESLPKGKTPYLYIYDAGKNGTDAPSTENKLISIRPKIEKGGHGAIRHYVEKGKRLVELLSMKPREPDSLK